MARKHRYNDDPENDSNPDVLLKRRKILSESQYTLAWICALPIEMAAAKMMLDEVHGTLPRQMHDTNNYVLGSIGHHNVVIACLPLGQYGTVKAAEVSTHLRRTFPSARLALMVGIGGGVPNHAHDIRLGDVVVGNKVMPYDLSKVVQNGQERIDHPKALHSMAGTALSALQVRHATDGQRFLQILEDRSRNHPEYGRPDLPDRLFQAAYSHVQSQQTNGHIKNTDCGNCDDSKIVPRDPRSSKAPMVHYGLIASGNKVVKNAMIRDQYARELGGVICFEMEAAGLMDSLPCITIRGICDYSDTHKNKQWQEFAAVVAASFARDVVEHLPVDEVAATVVNPGQHKATRRDLDSTLSTNSSVEARRRELLESLKFDLIDSRKTTIGRAHFKTCNWLLQLREYQQWLHQHGFLWIRGKPGVGKSTIMKFAYEKTKKKDRHGLILTVSFFFNARGDYLEKNMDGMYRSLLFQILEAFPDLQDVFDDSDIVPRTQNSCPSLDVLKSMLRDIILRLGERSLTCYIDALDECDEQQVADMVSFFEELSISATQDNIRLKVCFSSRHYPHIDIQAGFRLILEDLPGHTADLTEFIQATLKVNESSLLEKLQHELLKKSSGVFLWVALVVNILNKEYRRGGLALRKRLTEIPSGLTELFRDLIKRDSEDMHGFQLCVFWILCAARPLSPKEYCHAVWSGLAMRKLADDQPPQLEANESEGPDDKAKRLVVGTSKGLAEMTKGKKPTVQFIHESVRDFLITDGGLLELWPDLGQHWQATSHRILRDCCNFYLHHFYLHRKRFMSGNDSKNWSSIPKIKDTFPFLGYTVHKVLYHADGAADTAVATDADHEFLSNFALASWIEVHNATEDSFVKGYQWDTNLLYVLADHGLPRLIRLWLAANPSIDTLSERSLLKNKYQNAFFAAMATGSKDVIAAILHSQSTVFNGCDIAKDLTTRSAFESRGYKSRTPLTWAAEQGLAGFMEWILDSGVDRGACDSDYHTALSRAAEKGHQEVIKLLLNRGANVNDRLRKKRNKSHKDATMLMLASNNGHCEVAEHLLQHGADVDLVDSLGWTALMYAAEGGHLEVASLLLRYKADVSCADKTGTTSLLCAASKGHAQVTALLLNAHANVNHPDNDGKTALIWAAKHGHTEVASVLLDHCADASLADDEGSTALVKAVDGKRRSIVEKILGCSARQKHPRLGINEALVRASGNEEVETVRMLLMHDADSNYICKLGETALGRAARRGNVAIARLLLDLGANIDQADSKGMTALMQACSYQQLACARFLLQRHANIHHQDSRGREALSIAVTVATECNLEMVYLLIQYGAYVHINEKDDDGNTPLMHALTSGVSGAVAMLTQYGARIDPAVKDGCRLLRAMAAGRWESAKALIKGQVELNLMDQDGRTPLSETCREGKKELAEMLIDCGAQVDWPEGSSHTTLMRLCRVPGVSGFRRDDLTMIEFVISEGANVNQQGHEGGTPLIAACRNGNIGLAYLLLQNGAGVNLPDRNGLTPLILACQLGHQAMAEIFLSKGADVNFRDSKGRTALTYATKQGKKGLAKNIKKKGGIT